MKAMRNDDFNTILKLKMRGISAIGEHTEKPPAGCIRHHLHRCRQNLPNGRDAKSLQDIKPAQSPITGGNKRSMELGISTQTTSRTIQYNSKYINCYISYFDLTINIFTFVK